MFKRLLWRSLFLGYIESLNYNIVLYEIYKFFNYYIIYFIGLLCYIYTFKRKTSFRILYTSILFCYFEYIDNITL